MDTQSSSRRLTWIDTVKGIAILLVVIQHAAFMAEMKDWSGEELTTAAYALRTVRMPLFFVMSGFFFLRRVDRPWNWQLRNRTGPFLWLFALWTLVWVLAFYVIPWVRQPGYDLQDAARVLIDPAVGPWYIFALALYYVVAKLISPLPVWLQLVIGCAISLPVATGLIPLNSWAWENIITYFITFLIGALGNRLLNWIAEKATVLRLVVIGGLWAAGSGIVFLFLSDVATGGRMPVTHIPITLAGIAMGITAGSLVARHMPWLHLDWIGRNTLPIYLMHVPFVGILYSVDLDLPANPAVSVGAPLAISALAVAGSLGLWRILRTVPGLYTAPWTGDGANTRTVREKTRSAVLQ